MVSFEKILNVRKVTITNTKGLKYKQATESKSGYRLYQQCQASLGEVR
ncbi:hypothetical protein [Virgibacillus halodenitrificans]|nr:hypothetical protein [Virgibacillus halodenitrificans]